MAASFWYWLGCPWRYNPWIIQLNLHDLVPRSIELKISRHLTYIDCVSGKFLIDWIDSRVISLQNDVWWLEYSHCDWKQARWWSWWWKQGPPGETLTNKFEIRTQELIFQVNLARRQGVAVTTETKYGAGGNTQVFGLVLGAKIYCMDWISERHELKHCKAGPRDWGTQSQEGRSAPTLKLANVSSC